MSFLRTAPELALNTLGYTVSQPGKILYRGDEISGDSARQVLALVDHASKLVVVSGRRPLAERRFTLSHELAHIVLGHHDRTTAVLHREKSQATGVVVRDDPKEVEAEIFAATFLMPGKIVCELFYLLIGDPVTASPSDPVYCLIASLSNNGRTPSSQGAFEAAIAVAKTTYAGRGYRFASMASQLNVSPIALARRLIELKLVKSRQRSETTQANPTSSLGELKRACG